MKYCYHRPNSTQPSCFSFITTVLLYFYEYFEFTFKGMKFSFFEEFKYPQNLPNTIVAKQKKSNLSESIPEVCL